MSEKVYTIEEIRALVAPIAQAYGVERIYLFGSYARGEATPESDLDFRIDRGRVRGFQLGGLYNAISDILHKPIDLISSDCLDSEFRNEISPEEVMIYEQ
mgnify:CR=1 FL=1